MGTAWTEAHDREALAFLFETATRRIRETTDDGRRRAEADCLALLDVAAKGIFNEERFCAILHGRPNADAIVRRVVARAEGREVSEVETFWRVYDHDGDLVAITDVGAPRPNAARLGLRRPDRCRVVRVTLTRRRILKAKKGEG